MFSVECPGCGSEINLNDEQVGRVFRCQCGASFKPVIPVLEVAMPATPVRDSKRVMAGVCALLLGGLGIHKFVLGYTVPGIIMLLVSIFGVCLMGAPTLVMSIVGIVEGIVYLSKSDAEFIRIYQRGKQSWF